MRRHGFLNVYQAGIRWKKWGVWTPNSHLFDSLKLQLAMIYIEPIVKATSTDEVNLTTANHLKFLINKKGVQAKGLKPKCKWDFFHIED